MKIFSMNRKKEVKQLTQEEIDKLPEFVLDTLNIDCLALADGVMYGTSPERLKGEEP